jgi:hypothetical protein
MLKISDPSDRQLFSTSTIILLGNGHDTPFWEGRWLDAKALKELAPSLFKVAKWKKG